MNNQTKLFSHQKHLKFILSFRANHPQQDGYKYISLDTNKFLNIIYRIIDQRNLMPQLEHDERLFDCLLEESLLVWDAEL